MAWTFTGRTCFGNRGARIRQMGSHSFARGGVPKPRASPWLSWAHIGVSWRLQEPFWARPAACALGLRPGSRCQSPCPDSSHGVFSGVVIISMIQMHARSLGATYSDNGSETLPSIPLNLGLGPVRPGPMGRGPWARSHGPGTLGPVPWA